MFRKIVSVVLCLTLVSTLALGLSSCGEKAASTNTDYKLAEKVADGTILHCFCWDFKTITNSLEDIAAAGYSSIQTSPINECLVGEDGGMQLYGEGKWYYHYQPTDYKIGNYQLGTRDEFKEMCEKADKLGIKVIVDVVANHTTPTTAALGEDLLDAVGGIENLYHNNNTKDIGNYGDRLQCTTYKMGGLPDINTENKDYQDYIIKYLNDCISLGADGFRYDAAKHIALPDDPTEEKGVKNNFWTRITTEIKNAKNIYNYGEVLQGDNDRIGDYIDAIGSCTASSYGSAIRTAITTKDVDTAFLEDMRVSDRTSAVTWVESHDNYINDGNWAAMDNNQVLLGYAIIAARAIGTPLFFDRPYGSTVEEQWGTMNRIGTEGDSFYKSDIARAVNFFRTAMIGEDEKFYNPDEDSKSVQICRGNKGAVIVNTGDDLDVDFETDLADGTYTDHVDGETVYTVKGGKLTCDKPIETESVVVLYNEGSEDYAVMPYVSVSDGTSLIYDEDSLKVELVAENTTEASYSINGGKEKTFENGEKITIKSSDADENYIVTLELKGKGNADQNTYMKYCFLNNSSAGERIEEGSTVTFTRPDSWEKTLYAYVYDSTDKKNAEWPGVEMENINDEIYRYTFEENWNGAKIIFSDGNNQYPAAEQPGLDVENEAEYKIP